VAYCDREDLTKRLPDEKIAELADGDDAVVAEACEAASREVDRFLGSIIKVPLVDSNLVNLVRDKAADIAVYELFSRKGLVPESADAVILRRYEDAIAWLKAVAEGRIKLPSAETGEPRERSVVVSRERLFTDDKFEGLP